MQWWLQLRIPLLAGGLALALVLAACEETPNDFPAETIPEAPGEPGAPPQEPFPAHPEADPELDPRDQPDPVEPAELAEPEFSGSIEEVDGSGVSGELAIGSDEDGFAVIHAMLEGLDDDGTYTGNIHEGTCDAIADLVFQLGEVEMIEDGHASFLVMIEVPADNLGYGNYVFAVHEGGDVMPEQPVIACGEFEDEGAQAAE